MLQATSHVSHLQNFPNYFPCLSDGSESTVHGYGPSKAFAKYSLFVKQTYNTYI